ncbi:hypothetical protein DFJ73DRAFT_959497 [Zopfochytrium polystomum]|nr:hypothetical protein DFJ73DRAFT_959497 [Zopfochytrium polystomum]
MYSVPADERRMQRCTTTPNQPRRPVLPSSREVLEPLPPEPDYGSLLTPDSADWNAASRIVGSAALDELLDLRNEFDALREIQGEMRGATPVEHYRISERLRTIHRRLNNKDCDSPETRDLIRELLLEEKKALQHEIGRLQAEVVDGASGRPNESPESNRVATRESFGQEQRPHLLKLAPQRSLPPLTRATNTAPFSHAPQRADPSPHDRELEELVLELQQLELSIPPPPRTRPPPPPHVARKEPVAEKYAADAGRMGTADGPGTEPLCGAAPDAFGDARDGFAEPVRGGRGVGGSLVSAAAVAGQQRDRGGGGRAEFDGTSARRDVAILLAAAAGGGDDANRRRQFSPRPPAAGRLAAGKQYGMGSKDRGSFQRRRAVAGVGVEGVGGVVVRDGWSRTAAGAVAAWAPAASAAAAEADCG